MTAYPLHMDRELFEHYLADATRQGPAPDDAFTGAAGGAACGDLARISLSLADGRVAAVTFDTEGCGATRAATAAVAEAIDGEPILEAARLSTDSVETMIGGLTPAKRHAAVLAADALHRALSLAASSGVPLGPAPVRAGSWPTDCPSGRRIPPLPRVAVAMSGGVDSAVAALLERERGAEVIAVTVKLWADPETDGTKACCSPEAVLGARASPTSWGCRTSPSTSSRNSAPASSTASSRATPRAAPRTRACSATAKCGSRRCLASPSAPGPTRLLTGHYARIVEDADGPLLASGADHAKDQAYMLAALPPELLAASASR